MVARTRDETRQGGTGMALARGVRLLVLASPYYEAVTAELMQGVAEVSAANGCTFDTFSVPGALELPQALATAVGAGLIGGRAPRYAGAVVLGCVIRGETSHYDIVCNMTNEHLMTTAIAERIPLGNAVLTVDTETQAMARARGGAAGKGGDAARACLRLVALAGELRDLAGSETP